MDKISIVSAQKRCNVAIGKKDLVDRLAMNI